MKKFWLFFILLLLALAYLAGKYGPDPTLWFPKPTPTPTVTPVPSATATSTGTATASPTPTPTPRPVRAKPAAKKPAPTKAPPSPTPAPPTSTATPRPICTVQAQAAPAAEEEDNDVVFEAQDLGDLGANDWVIRGSLSQVGTNAVGMTSDAYKFDPKVPDTENDRDMYEFSTSVPGFDVYLDCYSTNPGMPNPVLNDRNYQLELYDTSFNLVAHSRKSDPVEHIRYDGASGSFYIVVYGFDGPPGKYRLTVRR